MRLRYLSVILGLLLLAGTAWSSGTSLSLDGISEQEALRLGERMYREGILPSGEPMQAVVMGDIPVDGRMFTCDDCHQRSGLGSVEGTVVTWPTTGRELYKPRRRTGAWRPPEDERNRGNIRRQLPDYWRQIEDVRPPYTEQSLARVLRTGVDPAGRKLDPIMPLYRLNDRETAILIHYLNNLSAEIGPGVDDKTIRFATVVTDGVAAEDRQAMLSTLQVHIDVHNAQSRRQEHRANAGPFYKTEMHQSYRKMDLAVWELKGAAETWQEQLEKYYSENPVFALLGGIADGSWQPVHDFCERNRIPAIFPLTDLPVVADSDWYTLYFSKGFYQEGEGVAKYLHSVMDGENHGRIVEVTRPDEKSRALRRGFDEIWQKFKRPTPEHLELAADEKPDQRFWQRLLQSPQPAVLLLWLEEEDLAGLFTLMDGGKDLPKIFISSSLPGSSFTAVPDGLRGNVYLPYRYILPGTEEKRRMVVERWLQARKIPVTDLEIQSKMYFLGWMLSGAVRYIRSWYFREYFMEGFDMMNDQDYAIAVYPRLTFGPGQRYASKGCYIVQLTEGPDPGFKKAGDWVIH